ncbi:hypothetical protein GCM10010421_10980 [Streptomyces glaucus]|uniref:Secreted protein n=1 Tax=Streptomyces glaucus TaxID=284029 RepID=A0ABP5WF57_9ACTN
MRTASRVGVRETGVRYCWTLCNSFDISNNICHYERRKGKGVSRTGQRVRREEAPADCRRPGTAAVLGARGKPGVGASAPRGERGHRPPLPVPRSGRQTGRADAARRPDPGRSGLVGAGRAAPGVPAPGTAAPAASTSVEA